MRLLMPASTREIERQCLVIWFSLINIKLISFLHL
jgi:hypothetical protein